MAAGGSSPLWSAVGTRLDLGDRAIDVDLDLAFPHRTPPVLASISFEKSGPHRANPLFENQIVLQREDSDAGSRRRLGFR